MVYVPLPKSYTAHSGLKYIGGHIEFLSDFVYGRYIDTRELDISMFILRRDVGDAGIFVMRITFDDETYTDVWEKTLSANVVGFGAPRQVFDLGEVKHIREIEIFKEGAYNHDWLVWGGSINISIHDPQTT